LPSYVSPTELLSITTFEDPKKDIVIGVYIIDSKNKKKLKNNEKEKVSNEETENKDNMHKIDIEDNNSKQNLKKRKYSEKSLVTDESDIKIKKKKKEAADQNIIDQLDEKKKPKPESEDKDNIDNEVDVADNNGRQSLKKRKYSSEKSFITDESKKKKKEVNQNITDQRNEKEKISKEDVRDKNNICDEIDVTDNIGSQSIKKGKYVTDENDIKVKKKRKTADQNIICQQNEKEKVAKQSEDEDNTYDDEIDASYNNDKQYSKKEKYALEKSLVVDESDVKKRRKTVDQTDQQNKKEKMPKEEHKDKNNTYDNKIDTADNNGRQNLKKRKLALEESCIKDEKNIKITENSNTENQDISIKNRTKVIEKKKRKLTINDTIAEDISEETIKKVCQKPITNSNKNKTTELEHPCEGDESNETNVLLQTEEHSMSDFGMRNSDIEETSVDERKKKKNRKKRSKIQDNICSKIGLQIMAKSDWKRLRNRYLDLQRHKMSQLKMHLRKAEVERDGIMTKNRYHDKTGQNNTLHDKLKYENDNGKFEEKKSYGHVNYAPGIIVKIEMDEPCTDLQGFKVPSILENIIILFYIKYCILNIPYKCKILYMSIIFRWS